MATSNVNQSDCDGGHGFGEQQARRGKERKRRRRKRRRSEIVGVASLVVCDQD